MCLQRHKLYFSAINQTEFSEAPVPQHKGAFGTVAEENFRSGRHLNY
jgi:hypothetical protein